MYDAIFCSQKAGKALFKVSKYFEILYSPVDVATQAVLVDYGDQGVKVEILGR